MLDEDSLLSAISEKSAAEVEQRLDQISFPLDFKFRQAAESRFAEAYSVLMEVLDHGEHNGFFCGEYSNPLFMAISEGLPFFASMIAEALRANFDGVLLSERDSAGRSAVELAREKGMTVLAEEIERYLASANA